LTDNITVMTLSHQLQTSVRETGELEARVRTLAHDRGELQRKVCAG
jgi:hypothetical protein